LPGTAFKYKRCDRQKLNRSEHFELVPYPTPPLLANIAIMDTSLFLSLSLSSVWQAKPFLTELGRGCWIRGFSFIYEKQLLEKKENTALNFSRKNHYASVFNYI
jgi:hypothetical protein